MMPFEGARRTGGRVAGETAQRDFRFNAGVSLFKAGKYKEAAETFKDIALSDRGNREDVSMGLGASLFRTADKPAGVGNAYNGQYGLVLKRGYHEGLTYTSAGKLAFTHWLTGDAGAGIGFLFHLSRVCARMASTAAAGSSPSMAMCTSARR